MSDAVIVGLLSFAGTFAASMIAHNKTSALISYRLEQLENKVNKHNEVIERTYDLEKQCAIFEEEIHRLEKFHE